MNRYVLVAAVLLCTAVSSARSEPVPSHLVGVWASEGAVLKGHLLMKGQALYIGANGVGALVGGPPPIGVKVIAQFDAATNRITLDMVEQGKVVGRRQVNYNPSKKIIQTEGNNPQVLQHRFYELTDETKKALGL